MVTVFYNIGRWVAYLGDIGGKVGIAHLLATELWRSNPEVESKEKNGVWDPMPELTITSPYVHSESTPTHLPWATLHARVDLNSMP